MRTVSVHGSTLASVPTASSTFNGGLNSVRDARRFLDSVLREWETDAYDFGAPQVLS
jgi:hypothetical protein